MFAPRRLTLRILELRAEPSSTVLNLKRLLSKDVERLREWLVSKAHRLVYHSSLGWRVMKMKNCVSSLHRDLELTINV